MSELVGAAGSVLLLPVAGFPLFTFLTSLTLAALVIAAGRLTRGRPIRGRILMRALFPKWVLRGGSAHVDLAFAAFNLVAPGLLFGWALLSGASIATQTRAVLEHAFGARAPCALPLSLLTLATAVVAMLAYEFGYWLDHWLKHRVPFLWEFHKVHHTARHLSLLTQYRVHPVDSVLFINMLAITGGLAQGATFWLLGGRVTPMSFAGLNVILLLGLATFVHLQHTEVWIPFTGLWGRLFLSPAHHQLHHSDDPDHHGRNLGSMFALFDWMFGTLLVPTRQRQKLRFGVGAQDETAGDIAGSFLVPFVRAWRGLDRRRPGGERVEPAPVTPT